MIHEAFLLKAIEAHKNGKKLVISMGRNNGRTLYLKEIKQYEEMMILSNFDYGNKKPDGQHERHPVNLDGEAVRPYRDTYIHDTCGVATTMPTGCAETYQKNPKFYQATFCCGCNVYLPVSQFKWKDGTTVGE